jgi:hypothetical protein
MSRCALTTLLVLLGVNSITYAQSKSTLATTGSERAGKWKLVEDSTFSIQYPPDWELNRSGQMNTSFIVFSPLSSEKDVFRENVNLLIQDLKGYTITLEKYTEISIEQVKTMLPKSAIVESKRISSPAGEYQRIVYTGDQGGLHLKFVQLYRIVNERAFVLTLTCEMERFDEYQADGEAVLNSFRMK